MFWLNHGGVIWHVLLSSAVNNTRIHHFNFLINLIKTKFGVSKESLFWHHLSNTAKSSLLKQPGRLNLQVRNIFYCLKIIIKYIRCTSLQLNQVSQRSLPAVNGSGVDIPLYTSLELEFSYFKGDVENVWHFLIWTLHQDHGSISCVIPSVHFSLFISSWLLSQ